jgi:hypothetical protein
MNNIREWFFLLSCRNAWSCGEEAGNSAQADGLDLPPHEKA